MIKIIDEREWQWCDKCPYATCDINRRGYVRCNFYNRTFLVVKGAGCRREKGEKDEWFPSCSE